LQEKVENLNYSAQRLLAVWPRQFTSLEQAAQYEKNPEKIANLVYASRGGNVEPGDGYKFRARGYLQTFGRAAYARLSQKLGVDLVSNPDLLVEAQLNARAAALVFAQQTEVSRKAGELDLVKTSIAIDGGIVGLDSKREIYGRIQTL
jgi:putative chitinase